MITKVFAKFRFFSVLCLPILGAVSSGYAAITHFTVPQVILRSDEINDLWFPDGTGSGQPFAEFDNVPFPGSHPTATDGFIWDGFNNFFMVIEGTRFPTESDPVDAFGLSAGDAIDIANQSFSGGFVYFAPESDRAIYGIQFATPGFAQRFYGWVEISSSDTNDSLTIHQWALEDSPNTTILAGDTGDGIIPEPNQAALGLGLLAVCVASGRRLQKLS